MTLLRTPLYASQVALWDRRMHSRPCSKLQGPQLTGALLSVQVAPDGRAVIAGSQCGQVPFLCVPKLHHMLTLAFLGPCCALPAPELLTAV